jgi:hypothetical protein
MSKEWLDLMFGNPVGLASMIVVFATFMVAVVLLVMFFIKSGKEDKEE